MTHRFRLDSLFSLFGSISSLSRSIPSLLRIISFLFRVIPFLFEINPSLFRTTCTRLGSTCEMSFVVPSGIVLVHHEDCRRVHFDEVEYKILFLLLGEQVRQQPCLYLSLVSKVSCLCYHPHQLIQSLFGELLQFLPYLRAFDINLLTEQYPLRKQVYQLQQPELGLYVL